MRFYLGMDALKFLGYTYTALLYINSINNYVILKKKMLPKEHLPDGVIFRAQEK